VSDGVNSHSPRKETQLAPLPAVRFLEFEIVNGPSALGFRKILQKVIVLGRTRCFQHFDFLVVLRQVKDDIFMLSALLQVDERFFGLL